MHRLQFVKQEKNERILKRLKEHGAFAFTDDGVGVQAGRNDA